MHNNESLFTLNKAYLTSPDAFSLHDAVIPPWNNNRPGSCKVQIKSPTAILRHDKIHIRSRLAQAGLDGVFLNSHDPQNHTINLKNYGAGAVHLLEGTGILQTFSASRPLQGYELVRAVQQQVEAEGAHLVYADMEGNIFSEMSEPEALFYLGVQVNDTILYEPDPENKDAIDAHKDVREETARRLRSVKEYTQTPFGVTTTVPLAIHGVYLTLQTDLYGDLHHISSVLMHPHRSQWKEANGNGLNSGIRLEFYGERPISREILPEYAFFTVHPENIDEV